MSDRNERNRKRRTRSFVTYGVLATLIAASVLYLVFRNTDRIQYELPEVAVPRASEFDVISISSQKHGVVEIAKRDGEWGIGNERYKIDATILTELLETIEEFELTELVSTAEYYERYDLDKENRIVVTVTAGNEVEFSAEVGKRAPTYNHTYVRLPGDGRVYQAAGNLRSTFDREIEAFRDKVVFSVDPETVTRISVEAPDRSYRLYRSVENGETKWKSSEDESEQDVEAITGALSHLDSLRCQEFVDEAGSTEPLLTLELQGEQSYRISISEKLGSSYRATSSMTPYAFTISDYIAEQLIEEFLGDDID